MARRLSLALVGVALFALPAGARPHGSSHHHSSKHDKASKPAKGEKSAAPAVDIGMSEEANAQASAGKTHFDLGELRAALVSYKEAYRIKANPAFLLPIAQCHHKLGELEQAISIYQAYLTQEPKGDRATAEAGLAEAKKTFEEREKEAREKEARDRDEKERAAMLAASLAAPAAPVIVVPAPEAAPVKDEGHALRNVGIVGLIAGVAAAGTGVAFAVLAGSSQSSFDGAHCGDPKAPLTQTELARCSNDRKDGEQRALLADVLLAAGGGVAAISLVLMVVDKLASNRAKKALAHFDLGPTSLRATFAW